MSTNKHLQAAGSSIASNILVQLLSRGLTFVLGAITLKYLKSSSILGIINVRLALLYSTVQFLSREPFRRGCLGEASRCNKNSWPKTANTIWLGLPLSILLAIPLAFIWRMNSIQTQDLVGTTSADYELAVLLTCLSAIIEMLSEPCFIYAQAKALTDHNPKVEVVLVVSKCILTCFTTIHESSNYISGQPSYILSKIACCQLIASLVSVMYSYVSLCLRLRIAPLMFMPSTDTKDHYLDHSSLKLTVGFVTNTFLKQILTEGERYVMTFLNVISLSEQGIYDVINNLGSLTARLVFKPIEDSGYTLFSQTVLRDELLEKKKFGQVKKNLIYLIKCMLLIGTIVLVFGYNFVTLVTLYGGDKLNNSLAFQLMRWQLAYTPILAINGITESFTFAIMNSAEVKAYNILLVCFSAIYLATIYLTQQYLGTICFTISNCMMMFCRILFSKLKIDAYFRRHKSNFKLVDVLPSPTTAVSLLGVFSFLNVTTSYMDVGSLYSVILNTVPAAVSGVFMILVLMFHEEDLVDFVGRLFKINLN